MSVKVKICATRSLKAAKVASDAGADFLGFNFTPSSTRRIEVTLAREIINAVSGKVTTVGVFQDQPIAEIVSIAKLLNLDYVQLHGQETPEFCKQLHRKIIKAFPFPSDFDIDKTITTMKQYHVDYYMIDRLQQGRGAMLNLQTAAFLAKEFPLVFAGGLNPYNVAKVIKTVEPEIVDVASGVETDGRQDLEKIKRFIKNAKEAL